MKGKSGKSEPVQILLYIPVLHNGYFEFFKRHPVADTLWMIGADLAREFSTFHTEIRAVDPFLFKQMISALNLFREVRVLDCQNITELAPFKIVTDSEYISRQVVAEYFSETEVTFDTIFLRYDEANVKSMQPVNFDRLSNDIFDSQMMELAFDEALKSSDWWRHVGAVLVKDGKIVAVAHNQSMFSEHMPYVFGNPRDFIEAGKLSHFSDVLHSEKVVLAEALRRGISATGASVYTSVFPCPDCAKMIACSGVKKCFFGSGHASLDGEAVLRSQGVELIYVPIQPRA